MSKAANKARKNQAHTVVQQRFLLADRLRPEAKSALEALRKELQK